MVPVALLVRGVESILQVGGVSSVVIADVPVVVIVDLAAAADAAASKLLVYATIYCVPGAQGRGTERTKTETEIVEIR